MSSLPTIKRRASQIGITGLPGPASWQVAITDPQAIMYAAGVADLRSSPEEVNNCLSGRRPNRQYRLPDQLRKQTEIDLASLATHDRSRQARVQSELQKRCLDWELKGTALVHFSDDREMRLEWRPIVGSAQQLVDYALALLLDDTRPWGRRFFRCHLGSCGKFFLASPPKGKGQFRTKYCSKEHQIDADREKNGERVAASRIGIPVKEWRKRNRK